MRFRRFWHRMWVSWHTETERRGRRKYNHATDSVRRHREALDRIDPQRELPWSQDFSEGVRISGPYAGDLMNEQQIDPDHGIEVTEGLSFHTDPVTGYFHLVGDPAGLDEPDSPEADHLFWEETAPEMVKRLERNDADDG